MLSWNRDLCFTIYEHNSRARNGDQEGLFRGMVVALFFFWNKICKPCLF